MSPYPDTRFCEEFNSIPTIVVNQEEEDLSAYFEENARDSTDAYLFYGARDRVAERSRSAEPATTSNYAGDASHYQPQNFSGLRTSHSYGSFHAHGATYAEPQYGATYPEPQYGANSQYSSLTASPTGPLDHAFRSLQMQDAGQMYTPTVEDPIEQLAPSISEFTSTKLNDNGDAAFIESLAEFLNS